ncbi:MAG: class I SAM-dependent rRNA methyltransferase [Verrucomicrobiae bacterium]|nr:class I SAM-dependent rRNA methyltransferase [Verrucomicrobiae bacterium]
MPAVVLKPGKHRRLMAGHCWVYEGEIASISDDAQDGDAVEVFDHRKRCLGVGLLNRRSQIVVRLFSRRSEPLGREFFRQRLLCAAKRRVPAAAQRLVFSEADLLPGLIVDKYGDCFVMQVLTLGLDQRKAMLVELLLELFRPAVVVERSDVSTRKCEGLREVKAVLFGEPPVRREVEFGGVRFVVDLLEDQKTGFYLDQVENHVEVARHCAGKRVLDCFCYHGAFALHAAKAGAASVEGIEISESAVVRARENAALNGFSDRVVFECANAFDVLKRYDAGKRRFDVIVLDPPTFTRTKQNVDDAVRGYKEINLRALKMLPPGGLLATFTCSHHVGADLFRDIVADAAADARKTVRVVKTLTQASDHPVLVGVPETEYLKGLLLEVIG